MVHLLLVFEFDIPKRPAVSIMYPFRICNKFGQFDSWISGKISEIFGELKFLCFHLHICSLALMQVSQYIGSCLNLQF
jgi:hypothetical protein